MKIKLIITNFNIRIAIIPAKLVLTKVSQDALNVKQIKYLTELNNIEMIFYIVHANVFIMIKTMKSVNLVIIAVK